MKIHKVLKLYKDNKGMTLVEIIVAIGVLGIISTFVIPIFATGMLIAVRSGDNTQVAMTAQSVMESAITKDDAVATEDDGSITIFDEPVQNTDFDNPAADVTVNFGGLSTTVSGKWLSTNSYSDNNDTSYSAFKPDDSNNGDIN